MKKGKVFGKKQTVVTVMIMALAAAVWLNMKYAPTGGKYLGEASYVNATSDGEAVQTSAKAEEDYFTEAERERDEARKKSQEEIKEILNSAKLTDEDKKSASAKAEELADRAEKENTVETLLKAKGFEKAIAVIGDKGINVVVKSEGLTAAQTLQIQDVVTSQTNIQLTAIKIIPVK